MSNPFSYFRQHKQTKNEIMPQTNPPTSKPISRPYQCQVDITFPSSVDAERAYQVLSVDDEIGNRITKDYSICSTTSEGTVIPCQDKDGNVLRV